MRHLILAALSGLALAAPAAPARAAEPAADAAKTYSLQATAEPAALKPGAVGTLRLAIAPTGTVHVDPKDVRVEVDLPFLLRPAKGTVESRINQKLDELLGKG